MITIYMSIYKDAAIFLCGTEFRSGMLLKIDFLHNMCYIIYLRFYKYILI